MIVTKAGYKIPTKTSELTFEQFLRIKDWDGIIYSEFIQNLLDIEFVEALEMTDTELKAKDFNFITELFNFEVKKKKTINISSKKIKLPTNLFDESTLGQFAELSKIADTIEYDKEDEKKSYDMICDKANEMCAIYLYPLFFETDFNSEKYKHVIKHINKCNYRDILNVVFFLLTKYLELKQSKITNLERKILKEKQGLKQQEQIGLIS